MNKDDNKVNYESPGPGFSYLSEIQNNNLQDESINNELKEKLNQMKDSQPTEGENKNNNSSTVYTGKLKDNQQDRKKAESSGILNEDEPLPNQMINDDNKMDISLNSNENNNNAPQNGNVGDDVPNNENIVNYIPNNGNIMNDIPNLGNVGNNSQNNENFMNLNQNEDNNLEAFAPAQMEEGNNLHNENIIETVEVLETFETNFDNLTQNMNVDNEGGISHYQDYLNNLEINSAITEFNEDDAVGDDFNSENYSSNKKSFNRKK